MSIFSKDRRLHFGEVPSGPQNNGGEEFSRILCTLCWHVKRKTTLLLPGGPRLPQVLCADPEGGQGVQPSPPPLKNHKNIGFSSNTGPDLLRNRSYEASIQCWIIIGTPVKRVSLAGR